ncbi:MAG: hypothetical protein Hyperionvirus3_98 [Hyperionvirus sp.]|uniref:Uncharacterized protein n=1 Tax=Hyperionvirus sp. TaxID=2487770 RepID=A0A3G5A7D2_9VIRU|nr:MAG: hypothetical protein Hyperionvirus3_98 [Hyperionvirus sp.]
MPEKNFNNYNYVPYSEKMNYDFDNADITSCRCPRSQSIEYNDIYSTIILRAASQNYCEYDTLNHYNYDNYNYFPKVNIFYDINNDKYSECEKETRNLTSSYIISDSETADHNYDESIYVSNKEESEATLFSLMNIELSHIIGAGGTRILGFRINNRWPLLFNENVPVTDIISGPPFVDYLSDNSGITILNLAQPLRIKFTYFLLRVNYEIPDPDDAMFKIEKNGIILPRLYSFNTSSLPPASNFSPTIEFTDGFLNGDTLRLKNVTTTINRAGRTIYLYPVNGYALQLYAVSLPY